MNSTWTIVILIVALVVQFIDLLKEIKEVSESPAIKFGYVVLKSIVIVGLGILGINEFLDKTHDKEVHAMTGTLTTPKTTVPAIVVIGSEVPFYGAKRLGFNGFVCQVEDGKLLVDLTLWAPNREIICTIKKSQWARFDCSQYQFNNNDSAFEVVTRDERVVFQIILKGGFAHFGGLLLNEDGKGIYAYPEINDTAQHRGAAMQYVREGQSFTIPNNRLQPLFRYPREEHLGERTDYYK